MCGQMKLKENIKKQMCEKILNQSFESPTHHFILSLEGLEWIILNL